MPKRSNLFQRVVFLIKQHLADPTSVTESAMLKDSVTGTLREVDVLVTGEIAGHTVYISIECRDHSRPQSVTWIEEMHTKHSRLCTNVLVLVSSSGFTREAQRVAKLYGIELVVPGVAEESAARSVVGRVNALWFKEVSLTLTGLAVSLDAPPELDDLRPAPDMTVFDASGVARGTLKANAEVALRSLDTETLTRDLTGEETSFEAVLEDPGFDGADGENPGPMFLRDDRVSPPVLRRIRRIHMAGDAVAAVAEVPLLHATLQGIPYAYGEADAGTKEVLLLVTEQDETSRKISVQFSPKKK